MSLQGFLDGIPILLYLLLATTIMVVALEAGFRVAQRYRRKPDEAQMAQVRAIMGASLALLAFMLAFSFSVAQRHFEERTDAYLLEVTAIDAAYRGASLLEQESMNEARELLRQFVQLRRDTFIIEERGNVEEIVTQLRNAERLHDRLWQVADSSMQAPGDSIDDSIFSNAILEMIRANDERVQHTMFNRISTVIWLTLLLMSILSMIIMGYQAGLTGKRSLVATWTLAITFAAVLTLVTDLDRPQMRLFKMNKSLMVELQNRISSEAPPYVAPEAN